MKDLRKSKDNKMLSGVLAGISKQYNWDLNLLRLLYFLIALFSAGFVWVIIYIAAAMIIPEEDDTEEDDIIDQ